MSGLTCSVCQSNSLQTLYCWSESRQWIISKENDRDNDCKLVYCNSCFHMQGAFEYLHERRPIYSGESRTMRAYFRELAQKIEKRFHLRSGDVVLDIGSNDGTFLRTFEVKDLVRVGIEVSDELVDEGKTGLTYFIHSNWSKREFEKVVGKKAKVVSALSVLEEIKNPLTFLRDIESVLTDDGICLLQITTLSDIISNRDIGFISSNHYQYFSINSLKQLLGEAQLEIFDIERVFVGGNSLRVYCRKKNSYVENEKGHEQLQKMIQVEEKNICIDNIKNFLNRINLLATSYRHFITKCREERKTICLYGLGERSFSIFNFLTAKVNDFDYIYDWNDRRRPLHNVIFNKEVLTEQELLQKKPDYLFLTPYHFINEFYQKENELRQQGALFVLPLPDIKIIS